MGLDSGRAVSGAVSGAGMPVISDIVCEKGCKCDDLRDSSKNRMRIEEGVEEVK